MNKQQKTLVTKLRTDVSSMTDKQIEALKVLHKASFEDSFAGVDFEVLIEDEESYAEQALNLYDCIQKEFKVNEAATKPSETTKPKSIFAELNKALDELGKLFESDEG